MSAELVEPPLWVGIDFGTQSVRTLIVDDRGVAQAVGAAPLRSRRTSGRRHEQNPDQWWEAVGVASRQAITILPDRLATMPFGALSVCSTSGTVLLTDRAGSPMSPALMYDDSRAVDELAKIRQHAGGPVAASNVQLSWALPKMSWLVRRYERGDGASTYVAHSADFITAKLSGHPVKTDTSHALKSGYDVIHDRWDASLLDAAGIDTAMLPDVVRPGTVIGAVTADAAAHTGIPAGTAVVAGMTDGCASQIASGAVNPGAWNSVLGTTLILKGVSTHLLRDPNGAVYNHRHPDDGWLPGGASNVGAGALADEFPQGEFDSLDEAAQAFEPAGGVIYPLTERGERFPFVSDGAVRFEVGSFSGPEERYAAILQGVAYVERLCFDHLAAIGADISGPVTVTGGAVRSPYWTQLRADVMGRELHLPEILEPSFGMAILASARVETVSSRAANMVRIRRTVRPRRGGHQRLTEGYLRLLVELERRGYLPDTVVVEQNRGSTA